MNDALYKLEKSDSDIDELLRIHKNLVYHMLSVTGQLQNQDAESAAWEALWDSLNTFDVFSKNAFSSYACRCMYNAIQQVIREQGKVPIEIMLEDEFVQYDETIAEEASVNRVETYFKQYVSTKRGTIRDVLLTWYSSSFEMSQKALSARCRCSISYVSRVQQGFRAYLSGKLKEG